MTERLQATGQEGTPTEAISLARIQQGDPEALAALYTDYGKLVLDVARHHVGPNNCGDVAGLVWLGLVRSPETIQHIDEDRGLAPWFVTSAMNASRDHLKSSANRRTVVVDSDDLDPGGFSLFDQADGYRGAPPDPYEDVVHRLALDSLMKTVAAHLRTPNDLAFLLQTAEMGCAAYAVEHGQKYDTVKNRVARLIGRLNDKLTNEEREQIADVLGARTPFRPRREMRREQP